MSKAVTYLTTGLEMGGAEIQTCFLATGFAARGWDVQLVSMLPADTPLVSRLTTHGVTFISLKMNPRWPDPRKIWRLADLLKENETDILHSHMVKANILGRLGGRVAKVPVQVSTAHNINEGGAWVQWAYRITDPLADVTTNVSQPAVDRYVEIGAVPADRIRLIPNGLDVSAFHHTRAARPLRRAELGLDSQFVWLAVGRLTAQKNYRIMLEAFSRVTAKHPGARLLIVGKGPLAHRIERWRVELGLAESVTLLGERSDVPELMSAADAYLMSSDWEGAPMVLLEASASQLPIVTTDVGGNSGLVEHGVTGLLTKPGDPAALADAMMRIMKSSPEERAAMGTAGRKRTRERFDLDPILDLWEGLYVEFLTKKGMVK